MITKVWAKDFKGLTFDQPLGKLNLITGPNGSGKSARTQAIMLAVMGYIPGCAKQNAEILDNYGTEQVLVVGIESEGARFERGFGRSGSGAVSQGYKLNGNKTKEVEFSKALALSGDPKILDIGAFMEISDQKKVDWIFSLYPPDGDLNQIEDQISATKLMISNLTQKLKSTRDATARLLASKPPLPPGSLSEISAKIEETNQKLVEARREQMEQEKAEAARKATEAAEKKAERKAAQEAVKKAIDSSGMATVDPGDHNLIVDAKLAVNYPIPKEILTLRGQVPVSSAAASIQEILDSLNAAGCKACAARLVALRELRKYKEAK
jgi:hypothetical protein